MKFYALVAQLDRVLGYEPSGRRFESFRVRHIKKALFFQGFLRFRGFVFVRRRVFIGLGCGETLCVSSLLFSLKNLRFLTGARFFAY